MWVPFTQQFWRLIPDFSGEATLNLVLGIVLAILAAVVLFGGVKRLGAVTEKLVPCMAVVYILACLAIILLQCLQPAHSISFVFVGAFTPNGVTGRCCGLHVPGHQLGGDETGIFLQ